MVVAKTNANAEATEDKTATDNAKAKLHLMKLATFGDQLSATGSYRHNDNMLTITGIEGDYDWEVIHPEEAAAMLEGANLAALIYTSPSHTPSTPRWRVLLPLSGPMHPSEREKLIKRVNGVLGGVLSGESFTRSQSYYYGSTNHNPAHNTILVEGRYLDQADELDEGAIGKPVDPTPTTPVVVALQESLAREVLGSTTIGDAALRIAISQFGKTGETHQTLLRVTDLAKRFVLWGHVDETTAIDTITAAAQECAQAVSHRPLWNGEVEQAYAGAKCKGFLNPTAWGFPPEMVWQLRMEETERDFPDAEPEPADVR